MADKSASRFPIGSRVRLADLSDDPYPVYRALLEQEPISWIEDLNMWFVVRHADVQRILLDAETFVTVSERSPILATFGRMMLTTEGAEQARYRNAARPAFTPAAVRATLESGIHATADKLIDGFAANGHVDLRPAFAARLPVLTMLTVFGLPETDEPHFRGWYNDFEAALSDFKGEPALRARANADVAEFRTLLTNAIAGASSATSLLGALVNHDGKLSEDEIVRNSLIILFGGISTVEALILNAMWALLGERPVLDRVRTNPALVGSVVDETMRWQAPVQSATRYVTRDVDFEGGIFRAGETVNCMLGAANRDAAVFADPDVFDIDRPNLRRHLGFAVGPHHCIGLNLAKAEARIALERLFARLPVIRSTGDLPRFEGHEFRQPRALRLSWDVC